MQQRRSATAERKFCQSAARPLPLRKSGEQGRLQRTVHHQARVAFLLRGVVLIVMDTMRIACHRGIAKQQRRIDNDVGADAVRIAPTVAANTDLNWAATGDGIIGPATGTTQTPFTISRTYTVSGAAAPIGFTIAYYASTSSVTSQNLNQAIFLGSESISATTQRTGRTKRSGLPARQYMFLAQ